MPQHEVQSCVWMVTIGRNSIATGLDLQAIGNADGPLRGTFQRHSVRTPKGGSAKQIVLAIDTGRLRMRWMSPREYARLQGTPDFPLVGTTIQQLWGFADAVCVPAIEWIDRHVLTPLFQSSLAPTPSLSA